MPGDSSEEARDETLSVGLLVPGSQHKPSVWTDPTQEVRRQRLNGQRRVVGPSDLPDSRDVAGLCADDARSWAARSPHYARLMVMDDALEAVEQMADWSPWVPFDQVGTAPRKPGVYMARRGPDGQVVYVGMAGPRAGGGVPGLCGRLGRYSSGRGMVSGLGEAATDRALADPEWLRERLAEVERGKPMRAQDWGKAAMARPGLFVRWAATADKDSALALERRVEHAFPPGYLWNRSRVVVVKLLG